MQELTIKEKEDFFSLDQKLKKMINCENVIVQCVVSLFFLDKKLDSTK